MMADDNNEKKRDKPRQLRVTRGRDVKLQRVDWWEEDWLPFGALSLLAGREGLGKSTIACSWCARETQAGNAILYIHSEDSREHTVAPRLAAAGADMDLVLFVDVETEYTETGNVILPYDIDALDELIRTEKITFIVLDAATSIMSEGLSGKDDREVRRFLEPLSKLAAKHNIVIVGLVHFGKRDGADSGKLILGSIAWSQVARSVLSVAADPDNGTLVVTNTKGNLAPRTRSAEARILSTPLTIDGQQAEVGVLEWLGETSSDARDFLAGEEHQSNRDVDDWLREYLEPSRQKATEIFQAADANGFSKDQVKRAKKRIGAQAVKDGVWWWQLATVVDGEVEDVVDEPEPSKGAEEAAKGAYARESAPLLPSRSEGVQTCSLDPREQPSVHAPLTAPLADEPSPVDQLTAIGAEIDELLDHLESTRDTTYSKLCRACGHTMSLPSDLAQEMHESCRLNASEKPTPLTAKQRHELLHPPRNRRRTRAGQPTTQGRAS